MRQTLVCLAIVTLSGCATTSATDCAWAQIITVSKDDVLTDQTAREILAHNEKVEVLCHY